MKVRKVGFFHSLKERKESLCRIYPWTGLTIKEVDQILQTTEEDKPKYQAPFALGDIVKIINGPFADFIGTIESIDQEKGKIRVLISIFERETPVELDFLQVSKEL